MADPLPQVAVVCGSNQIEIITAAACGRRLCLLGRVECGSDAAIADRVEGDGILGPLRSLVRLVPAAHLDVELLAVVAADQ